MTFFGLIAVLAVLVFFYWAAGKIKDPATANFARIGLVVIACILIFWAVFGGINLHDLRLR